MNISEFLELSETYDIQKTEYPGESWNIEINDDMAIQPTHKQTGMAISPLRLTDHALTQLAQRVGTITPSVAKALRNNPEACVHAARTLEVLRQQQQSRGRTREWLVRGYQDNARAIMTTSYANTPNSSLIRQIIRAIEEQARQSNRVVDINHFPTGRSEVTPDDIYMYVSLNSVDVPGAGGYKVGFSVRNSEIGTSGLYVRPYVQRTSCMNSILFSADEFYSIHRGSGAMLMSGFSIAVGNALSLSMDGLQRLLDSREIPVPNIQNQIEELALKHGWTTDFVASVGIGTEGHESVFGLVNGITYAAHRNYDGHEEMMRNELIAGNILMGYTNDNVL
jgi:hypothetical protein